MVYPCCSRETSSMLPLLSGSEGVTPKPAPLTLPF